MKTWYNRIAGHSIERLAALSDGIFAVAMTLLVLDLRTPAAATIHSEGDLWAALSGMAPQLTTWVMSFLTLGIFWNGQQAQLNHIERGDRHLTWIHIAFLCTVSIMPFSTRLLAEFIAYRIALLCYWANILLLGATLFLSWRCALGAGLTKPDMPAEVSQAIKRRILVAQALYAAGAALCFINIWASIAVIVLIQLNFAFAPRLGRLSRF